jgi:hypothetical protein
MFACSVLYIFTLFSASCHAWFLLGFFVISVSVSCQFPWSSFLCLLAESSPISMREMQYISQHMVAPIHGAVEAH